MNHTRFMDCWKTVGDGVEHNFHTAIVGEIAREWETENYRWMRMFDGRVFCQNISYCNNGDLWSPYGWEFRFVSAQKTKMVAETAANLVPCDIPDYEWRAINESRMWHLPNHLN